MHDVLLLLLLLLLLLSLLSLLLLLLLCISFCVASLTHAVAEGQSRCNCFYFCFVSFSSIACTSRAAPESRAQFYKRAKQTRASRVRRSYEVRRSSLRCLRRVASPKK